MKTRNEIRENVYSGEAKHMKISLETKKMY